MPLTAEHHVRDCSGSLQSWHTVYLAELPCKVQQLKHNRLSVEAYLKRLSGNIDEVRKLEREVGERFAEARDAVANAVADTEMADLSAARAALETGTARVAEIREQRKQRADADARRCKTPPAAMGPTGTEHGDWE